MMRALLAVLLLAMPAASTASSEVWKELETQSPAPVWSLEAASALMLRDDPQGSLFDPEMAWGARLGVDLSRPLDLPDRLHLQLGLLWYGSSRTDGTRAVQVRRGLHSFALPVRAGWELGWMPFGTLQLLPYLTGGPAAHLTATDYFVADPLGIDRGFDPQETSASGWQAGAVYGVGLGISTSANPVGLSSRLEVLRLRRGPNDDLAIGVGIGARY